MLLMMQPRMPAHRRTRPPARTRRLEAPADSVRATGSGTTLPGERTRALIGDRLVGDVPQRIGRADALIAQLAAAV